MVAIYCFFVELAFAHLQSLVNRSLAGSVRPMNLSSYPLIKWCSLFFVVLAPYFMPNCFQRILP